MVCHKKFTKYSQKICKNLRNICEIFAKNSWKIRKKFAKNSQKIREKLTFVNFSGFFHEFFANISQILIFREFFANYSRIFREYFTNFTQIFRNRPREESVYSLQNEGMASRVLTTKKKQIIDIFCDACLHYHSVYIQQKFCCGF